MTKSKLLITAFVVTASILTSIVLLSKSNSNVAIPAEKQLKKTEVNDDAIKNNTIKEVPVPDTPISQSSINTVNQLTINGTTHLVNYTQLMKTGHKDNGEIFGALKDEKGNYIRHPDNSIVICNGTSNSPTVEGSGLDNTSIIKKDGKIHMVSQFECHIGAIYTAELKQSSDGVLSPVANTLTFIDQSEYKGGWVHCAGTKTPWNSHLGSEELEPDARYIEEYTGENEPYYASARHYFAGDIDKLNPYFYGWIPEVKIENGKAVYQKHYALGRASHELAYVMPDQKTVYMTDDGTNGGFYRFIADTEADLSAGNLYAAKWKQTSSTGAGTADLSWIHLGHIQDADVKKLALSGDLSFSAVLDADDVINASTGTCNANYTYVNTQSGPECLAYKDINGDALIDASDKSLAAALEKRRVAAMEGATTEFRKLEGFTYDKQKNKAYVAVSAISRGMEAGYSIPKKSKKYDIGGNNDVNLTYNRCGAVYELSFEDASDPMKITRIASLIEGAPLSSADELGNTCDVNTIANPDNISFIKSSDTLVISEDSDYHTNNFFWTLDVSNQSANAGTNRKSTSHSKNKRLTRIASIPLNAEATSPYWHEIGNFGYISMVSQHPMKHQDVEQSKKEASIGLIGPIPIQ